MSINEDLLSLIGPPRQLFMSDYLTKFINSFLAFICVFPVTWIFGRKQMFNWLQISTSSLVAPLPYLFLELTGSSSGPEPFLDSKYVTIEALFSVIPLAVTWLVIALIVNLTGKFYLPWLQSPSKHPRINNKMLLAICVTAALWLATYLFVCYGPISQGSLSNRLMFGSHLIMHLAFAFGVTSAISRFSEKM